MNNADNVIALCTKLQDSFVCARCARCCHKPSIYWTRTEVQRLATVVDIDGSGLVRHKGGGYMIHNKDGAGCPFLVGGLCSVYEMRPEVCRRYPFLVVSNIEGLVKDGVFRVDADCAASFEHYQAYHRARGLEVRKS